MKDAKIVVTAEVPIAEVKGMTPQQVTHHCMGAVREKARTTVEEAGGRFDVNRMESVEVSLRTSALGLGDFIVIWSVWRVEAPESVELDTGRPA